MLRVVWYDWRLEYPGASAGGCFGTNNAASMTPEGEVSYAGPIISEIWHPDIAFLNLVDDAPFKAQYSAFWLYPDGLVWWSQKLLIKLACDFPRAGRTDDRSMDFTQMPYDTHRCPMRLTTFRDTSDLISFRFLFGTSVQIVPGARTSGVAEWELEDVIGGEDLDAALTGAWADSGHGLVWTFVLRRKPRYYEVSVLVPSSCVVVFAYLSFFITRASGPARATVPVVAFLVLTSQSNSVASSIPRSNDDVWLVRFLRVSSYFVLWAAICYAVCNMLTRVEARVKMALADKQQAINASQDKAIAAALQSNVEEKGDAAHHSTRTRAEVDGELHNEGIDDELSDQNDIVVHNHELAEIELNFKRTSGRLGRLMYSKRLGCLWLRDEHIDIANRYLFPLSYANFVGVMYGQLGR